MYLKRREFSKLALAAAAAPLGELFAAKPNSIFSGVVIGTMNYSFRSEVPAWQEAEPLLKLVVDSGISHFDLWAPAAENYAGSPGGGGGRAPQMTARAPGQAMPACPANAEASAPWRCRPFPKGQALPVCPANAEAGVGGGGGRGGSGRGGAGGGRGDGQAPEQLAAAEALKAWRLSVSMDKFKALGKMYNDAGVNIYSHRLTPDANSSDAEFDYYFNIAKAMGATQLSLEVGPPTAFTQKLGDFAAKHGMMASYHCHQQATITSWDGLLEQSKGNGVNLDCGNYLAGTGLSPIPVIEKYANWPGGNRIGSIHLKDRTTPAHCSLSLPWGQGETPIVEILQTIRKNKWTFPVSIEMEYQIPEGSNAVAEVKECVEYCKKALA